MSTVVKAGKKDWDYIPGYGPSHTKRNYQNLDDVEEEASKACKEADALVQAGAIGFAISFASGVAAVALSASYEGDGSSDSGPCDGLCVTLAITSALSGITSIALCCIHCIND